MFKRANRLSGMLTSVLIMAFLAMLSGCSTGGLTDTAATPTGGDTGGTTAPTPASLNLSPLPTTVKSDGSTLSTITVSALNAANAALSGVTVTLSTNTGVLGAPTVVTSNETPATVTFSSGGSPINRTATITATAGAVSAQIPIQIVGSTVTLTSTGTTLPNDGTAPLTLTVTAKDAGNIVVANAAVVLTSTGAGTVTVTPASGTTLSDGTFTATVKGTSAGPVTLTAASLGTTATKEVTVAAVGASFAIDQQKLNGVVIANDTTTAMKIGDTLELQVNAPSGGTVTFATTIGAWDGGATKEVTKTVTSGKATATLRTTQAGVANVQVYANSDNDTLTVAMSSGAAAYRIILQAEPTNVPVSVGTTTGSSTLTATVYDNAALNPNPVGGVPVLFSIVNPTSGGETVLPVVATTAETTAGGLSLGQARASLTSGSMPSGADGIKIRATVVGTTVETGTSPSGADAAIIIGGVAGSIAFGQATVIAELDPATYKWPMSVLVADSGGAALANAAISLSVWPIAWSTGEVLACAYDADNPALSRGTFWNEDRNENLFLDATPAPAEDGARYYYTDKTKTTLYNGTADGYITPTNSAGGTVPSTVTTSSNGVATFNLTYPKQSAIWTIVRIRATTTVMGSETRGEQILRLTAAGSDTIPCILGYSPYKY